MKLVIENWEVVDVEYRWSCVGSLQIWHNLLNWFGLFGGFCSTLFSCSCASHENTLHVCFVGLQRSSESGEGSGGNTGTEMGVERHPLLERGFQLSKNMMKGGKKWRARVKSMLSFTFFFQPLLGKTSSYLTSVFWKGAFLVGGPLMELLSRS